MTTLGPDNRTVLLEGAQTAHGTVDADLSTYRLDELGEGGRAFARVGHPPMEALVGTSALDSTAWADLKAAVTAAGGIVEGPQ